MQDLCRRATKKKRKRQNIAYSQPRDYSAIHCFLGELVQDGSGSLCSTPLPLRPVQVFLPAAFKHAGTGGGHAELILDVGKPT